MNVDALFSGAVSVLILVLSVCAHESAHAWMADRCGDPTARLLGRVSLNPLVHLDLFGTILVPLALAFFKLPVFGWGRPAPILAKNLRRRGLDDALVSAAGPAVNLFLAGAAAAGLLVAVAMTGPSGRNAALVALGPPYGPDLGRPAGPLSQVPLMTLLARMAGINGFLGIFNLLPIPPFDGGRVILGLLPPAWALRLSTFPRPGIMIALAVSVAGVLGIMVVLWAFLFAVVSML